VPSLTIASSPDPSMEGRRVTVTGRATGVAAGTIVTLWQRLPSQQSFHRIAQAPIDSSGQYTIVLARGTVLTNRDWYASTSARTSATITQQVRAAITLVPAAGKVASGSVLSLSGRVSPSHAAERVLVEENVGGTWKVIARPMLNHSSRYTAGLRLETTGKVKLRTVLPGDRRNIRSQSRVIVIAVG
jgi:hypothetical protein